MTVDLQEGGEEWDAARNPETLRLAFDESAKMQVVYGDLAKSLETKLVAVFGVACALVALAPALRWGASLSGVSSGAWAVSLVAWTLAVAMCYIGYEPQDFRVDPNPGKLKTAEWLRLEPDQYRYYRLRDMGHTHNRNLDHVSRKAKYLGRAMVWTAIEVAALVFAFLYR
jgi:hypothetical protein